MKRQAETRATQQKTNMAPRSERIEIALDGSGRRLAGLREALTRKNNPVNKMQQRAAESKMPKEKSPVAETTIPNTTASAMPTNGRRGAMHDSGIGIRNTGCMVQDMYCVLIEPWDTLKTQRIYLTLLYFVSALMPSAATLLGQIVVGHADLVLEAGIGMAGCYELLPFDSDGQRKQRFLDDAEQPPGDGFRIG